VKKWHPDLNPGDPKAGEKMAALSAAAEILTGIDASSLPSYAGVRFSQELHRSTIEAGGRTFTLTMGMQVSEKFASDWVYAASFAGASDSVYLAGYSGDHRLHNHDQRTRWRLWRNIAKKDSRRSSTKRPPTLFWM